MMSQTPCFQGAKMSNESEGKSDYARSDYTNTSRVIHKGPLEICCVLLAADGNNEDCQIYDGENANGEFKSHLESLSGTSFTWGPGLNVKFNNGLYIAVRSATSKVTVTYRPLSRKEA